MTTREMYVEALYRWKMTSLENHASLASLIMNTFGVDINRDAALLKIINYDMAKWLVIVGDDEFICDNCEYMREFASERNYTLRFDTTVVSWRITRWNSPEECVRTMIARTRCGAGIDLLCRHCLPVA